MKKNSIQISFKETFARLVIDGGLPPEWVMDDCPMYLIDVLFDRISMKDKNILESNRMITWSVFQSQSTKQIKPQDILKFSWENEEEKKDTTPITQYDKERLVKRSKEIANKFFNGKEEGISD